MSNRFDIFPASDLCGRGIIGRVEASGATTQAPAPAEGPEGVSGAENAPEGTSDTGRQGDQTDSSGERDETGRYLSREAATYRRRLRETEAERDQLRSTLDELQRGEVERLAAAAGMAVPGDLWSTGTVLANCRDDDGRIDVEVVQGLVDDVLRSRPTWRAPVNGDLGIGKGNAASGGAAPKVGLSALLKGQ